MTVDILGGAKLNQIGFPAKCFLTMFIIIMGLGYLMAVTNIQTTIGVSYTGIVNHYRGSEKDPAAFPGMDLPTLTSTTHTHLFTMSIIFFTLGLIFISTTTLKGWKYFILVVAYIFIPLDLGAAWITKYITPNGAYLMLVAGGVIGICLFFVTITPLYEMWVRPFFVKEPETNDKLKKGGNN